MKAACPKQWLLMVFNVLAKAFSCSWVLVLVLALVLDEGGV
jgi:hypothetical protein